MLSSNRSTTCRAHECFRKKLTAALQANAALRQAEQLIEADITPNSDRPATINDLISLFDGPQQREAKRLASEALNDDRETAS